MLKKKPIVLTFLAHYLPGYKSGGPVRTIANLVEHLGDEYEFKIVTSDRDAMDTEPYPNIKVNTWIQIGKAKVYYASPDSFTLRKIIQLINNTVYDVLYLNSFFCAKQSILPILARRLGLIPRKIVILAPRGEFSSGALSLKSWKKVPYMFIANFLGMYRDIIWHASSKYESEDIRGKSKFKNLRILIAPNLSAPVSDDHGVRTRDLKEPLKIVFLSRITPMKNLEFSLKVLSTVSVPVLFNIYGPVWDERYWSLCQSLIRGLPQHIEVRYHGAVYPMQIPKIMHENDLFFLPTLGENYGHVIAEALTEGTPVLIANTTPWVDLDTAGVGWDLDLAKPESFVQCIEQCSKLSEVDYKALRTRVKYYASIKLNNPERINKNKHLFDESMSRFNNEY